MDNSKHIHPHVTFVILNWNQGAMTCECLASLYAQNYRNFEIIIVDNGSTDDSVNLISTNYPEVDIIKCQENVGYSEGNNIGIRHALNQKTNFVFLLNNDTVVDRDMLQYMIDVANSDDKIGITGPTMFYFEPDDVLWGGENVVDFNLGLVTRRKMGEKLDLEQIKQSPPKEVDYIDSCAILVRADVLREIGMLDKKYFINFDDVDFNLRARKAGYKVVYVPYALMWHKVSAAMGIASPRTTYYFARNSLLFFYQNAPGYKKLLGLFLIMMRNLRTLFAWTIRRRYATRDYRNRRRAVLFGMRDFLFGRFGGMSPEVDRSLST